MDELDDFSFMPAPSAARPLLGLTILAVEDSRFACEAMRLLCLRSGARIRRADCLRSARRHLKVYRPSVTIIDLGLPDGSGAELIEELANTTPRVSVILGTSGDDAAEEMARAAGADGFLAKPIKSLSAFQRAIIEVLPEDRRPMGPRKADFDEIEPDQMAYQDDMAHAADILSGEAEHGNLDYVAQFLCGVAQSADDRALYDAAHRLGKLRASGEASLSQAAHVAGLVHARLEREIAI